MGQVARAFLGTGLNGAGFAQAACGRGDHVVVWNRTASKAEALSSFGARVAKDPAAAVAEAKCVHVTLTSDAAVDAVIEAAASGLRADAVVLDHSTNAPVETAARFARLAEKGIRYLHCPVFMSPKLCREAGGLMLVSGSKALYDEVADDLAVMTGKVIYMGEDPKKAATQKLVGNGMLLAIIGGLADVLTLAEKHGVASGEVLELLLQRDLNAVLRGRGAAMAEKDFSVSWTLTMARKDLGLMLEAAEDGDLGVLPGLGARMDQLIDDGEGEKDLAVLARDAGN